MNGLTTSYLNLTAVPEIGPHLLDARPAMVFAADGTRVVWSNAAAVAFFEEAQMGDLLRRRFSGMNPLVQQIGRLSRILPSNASRMEILRIGRGTSLANLPAACRRLNLTGSERVVLAVAAVPTAKLTLRARAEQLADVIAGPDCLAAIMAKDGRVLGASGGFTELEPMESAIDDLIEHAAANADPLVRRDLVIDGARRPAGVVQVRDGDQRVFLVLVGPAEPLLSASSPEIADAAETRVPAVVAEATTLEGPIDQVGRAADIQQDAGEDATEANVSETVRDRRDSFVWETGDDGRLRLASPPLAEAVGEDNAHVLGRRWDELGGVLGFDVPDDEHFTAFWPVSGSDETVRIDISYVTPVAAGGTRGFGIIHLDERRRDGRSEPTTLAAAFGPSEPEAVGEPPSPPITDERPTPADKPTDAGTEGLTGPIKPEGEQDPSSQSGEARRDLDDAARMVVEAGGRTAARFEASDAKMQAQPTAANVVRLPGAAAPPRNRRPLSGHEREAFQRIGETLRDTPAEPDVPQEEAPPAEPVEPVGENISPITEAILERIPIGLMILRHDETLHANRSLVGMLGYDSADELTEAGGVSAVFPGEESGWSARNRTPAGGRFFAVRRDGRTVVAEVSLHAVTWAGASALMLAVRPEAGDRDHDDLIEELASSATRIAELESVLDTATDGTVVINREGMIANLNRAAEALFGVDSSDMVGRPFTDLLAEESHRDAHDYLDGLASNGVASVLNDGREVIGRVPRGGLIPLFMTMGRIGEGDAFCAVLRDMTHWKNVAEELIAARSEAEAANQQKSEFLAKVSHEIRTPLNAIIGFSEVMMEERFGPIGNDRYRSYLRDIHTSGGHLMSLINDLLDLSKIEAGKLDLVFESVPVNDVIQESVALMQPQANRERIIIRTSLSADVPNVVADHRSVRQILLNLLSNAIKFTRAGGQVIVSTALEESGEVVLRIRDTGVGMSEKDVEEALQPFRQLATTKRESPEGTGLGLPLTKALVEANRASFDIKSTPDQGTLIRITFPTPRVLAG